MAAVEQILRLCDDVLSLDTLVGLVDAELSVLEIEVRSRESKQLTESDPAPVEHLKGVERDRLYPDD